MKEQIKNSIKQVLNNYNSINENCLNGFIVSEFILQKEKVIKKIQYSGEPERVIFDYSENYEAIVSIKDLANCIRDGLKNLENINMNVFIYTNEGDVCIDEEVLKKDIALVHNFRNMLAHGFFEIKGTCIETFGRLACSIDISNLEKFNEHIALTNIKPLNDGCIVNCFDEIERIKVKDKIILMDALKKCPDKSMWSFVYANAFFSLNDVTTYSNFNTSYFDVISGNENYNNFRESRHADFAHKMEAKNKCFSNYRKCNYQKGKSNISKKAASKVVFDDSKNTEFMKEILGSQFRNAVMHGNFCIMDTGDILLFDTNNQYNPGKINKFFVISLENFVDLINNSCENSIDIYETETKNYLSRAIANLERFDRLSADWIENDLSIWDVINIKREDYLKIISDLYFIKYSENFDIRYNQNLLMDNIRDVSLLMWRVQDRIFNYIILNSWDENLINQYLFDQEMECDRVTSAIENSTLFELFLESDKFIRNYIKWLDYCYITTVNNYEASIYGDDDFIEKKGKFNENLRYLCSKLKEISEMFNEPILVSNNKIGLKIKHKSL